MKTNKKGNKELTTSVKFQNGTTTVDAPNPTKSIEAIADNGGKSKNTKDDQPKPFLTKKKVILTIVFLLISIGFAVITVRPILKVDWNSFNIAAGTGIAEHWGWLWLFLILIQMFVNFVRGYFTFVPRLLKWGYKIPFKDYMLYAITFAFVAAVSPSNLISDPYSLFWLRTQGVPTSKAVSMFFTNSLFWQISQIILTMPFFIICCVESKMLTTRSPADALLFSMICIGVIIDFISLVFFVLLNWSKQFHYFCSRVYNWFKKKLHMKYHTKEETAKKYKEKAVLKQSFIDSMKDWKTSLAILAAWLIGDILGLLSMVVCLNFVQFTIAYPGGDPRIVYVTFDIGKAMLCARLATPANRMNFLPGQAMGYPAALMELLNVYGGWKINPSDISSIMSVDEINAIKKNVVSNAILTGQIFFGWIPAIAGIAGFIVLTKQQIQLSNKGKLFAKK